MLVACIGHLASVKAAGRSLSADHATRGVLIRRHVKDGLFAE